MAIRVALNHCTTYHFDRPITISPHEIRLRPAPHTRTPIISYSLNIEPKTHFLNWQQDPYGNYIARLVFPEKADKLEIEVDLIADMTVINPFDFFVEEYAEKYPFNYPESLAKELAPFLETSAPTPHFAKWLSNYREAHLSKPIPIVDKLVAINSQLANDIRYLVRMEPGVQTPEETLTLQQGSCRDTSWLMVNLLRHLGLAARFCSGYLIQLTADIKAIDGPAGPEKDFTDLHAWCEVYIPGAGWVGLDPTSGLFAGEGHIPLAATASPGSAAPVIGMTEKADVKFDFAMSVRRVHEDPRVTKPVSDSQWAAINKLGFKIDAELKKQDVRLTQGGEPTFISIDDMEGPEWNFTALSPKKYELGCVLTDRIAKKFAGETGYLLHVGQGKWYPGEPLPRWALNIYWRHDGKPIWKDPQLLAPTQSAGKSTLADAQRLMRKLVGELGLAEDFVITAYEDMPSLLIEETALPINLDPLEFDLSKRDTRMNLGRVLQRGLDQATGFILPLKPLADFDAEPEKIKKKNAQPTEWFSSLWPIRRERLYLLKGDSPMGLRLPLNSLPWVQPEDEEYEFPLDPFASKSKLAGKRIKIKDIKHASSGNPKPQDVIKTALAVEVRNGHISLFFPPLSRLEDYLDLLGAIETVARQLKLPVVIEGYPPPRDERVSHLAITPDPGVIEVNIHPSKSWEELTHRTETLYEEARQVRLGTDKFMQDGRHTGTGGGNHVTFGGATAADSPLLRRPQLLGSLILYWQNHPSLSYLFSGTFIGPTSQAPRVDEARDDRLYELEIALQQLHKHSEHGKDHAQPWLIDRLLRHLLTDLTGNTHRSEFCIDKLYSPDGPTGRLGLLEFRGFEMPPHWQMSCLQMLLLRALIARFWKEPYRGKPIRWGTALHDEFMLPHFVESDFADVLADLRHAGYPIEDSWFASFIEFRFPRYGTASYDGITLELRQAIEPWHVLGEEMSGSGTSRYVDSSVERMQLKVNGMTAGVSVGNGSAASRYAVTCNGRPVPLAPTGVPGEYVAGIRFRAWAPPSALHPTIGIHAPLVFDLVDTWSNKSLGGCTYHVVHPGGRSYEDFPINANAAEARRFARFTTHNHTPGEMHVTPEPKNPSYPYTLDLRWEP
ncbi:DUF2126 domain-containing protein [Ampullimonas aquatilis]|uniref:transglutaminase family protein n=1 Tax=Ampullimonas aquatilis TaxID=1341549 RepID=UPI003C7579C3